MKLLLSSVLAWGMPLVCLAAPQRPDRGDWKVLDEETIHKSFSATQLSTRVVVDNVEGYVHVRGGSESEVHITAHKLIRAETQADLQQARSEVKLSITDKPGTVSIYYDAAWRCDGDSSNCHSRERRFYSVVYDIDVEAPTTARLFLSSVNSGDIQVDKNSGDFEVKNVNGGITMSDIAGSGSAHTVNGPVQVRFLNSPVSTCSFKTINGGIDVWFPGGLSADLLLKTFNGEVYSDFDVLPRAVKAAMAERRDGKFVYHSDKQAVGRIGSGGPELSFDTLNGSIRLHREK